MEALFLHIWLKRQEAQINHTMILARGLAEMVGGAGGQTQVPARVKEYIESVFPFIIKTRSADDQKMLDMMQKEVAHGPITFSAIPSNPFTKVVKDIQLDDGFKKKLEERAYKKERK